MTKLIFIVVVTVLLVLWFKSMGRKRRDEGGERDAAPPKTPGEDMVRCRVCGVHMPRSEALLSQGQTYCSDDHRRLDQD